MSLLSLCVHILFSRLFKLLFCVVFFFFKQKTAYEMRISDWSSDVCSSDLLIAHNFHEHPKTLWSDQPDGERIRVWECRDNSHEIGRASCRERVCQYV